MGLLPLAPEASASAVSPPQPDGNECNCHTRYLASSPKTIAGLGRWQDLRPWVTESRNRVRRPTVKIPGVTARLGIFVPNPGTYDIAQVAECGQRPHNPSFVAVILVFAFNIMKTIDLFRGEIRP